MSWNVVAGIEREGLADEVQPMVLVRASRGFTSTATVGVGDKLSFSGIIMAVYSIVHGHSPPMTDRAPISTAYAKPEHPLSEGEVEVLRHHGFRNA